MSPRAPRAVYFAATFAVAAATITTWVMSGCAISGPPAPPPAKEDVAEVTQAFAFTPDCMQCAAGAVAGVCGQAAEQCLNDPACADVSGCVAACPPGDPMCMATCYQQASAVLDVLAECVVCQECPVECAGAWPCGGGGGAGGAAGGAGGAGGAAGGAGGAPGGGACDNQGMCEACVACAIQNPPCDAVVDACLTDPTCLLDPTPAFECVVCQECANDCAGAAASFPGLTCP